MSEPADDSVQSQDNEFDGKPRKSAEFSPEELDVMAAEVQRDIAEGRGAKHFTDVLDELHSTQAQPKHEQTAEERDSERRAAAELARQLKRDASEALLSQGLRAWAVFEVPGDGFRAHIKDRVGREFEVLLSGKVLIGATSTSAWSTCSSRRRWARERSTSNGWRCARERTGAGLRLPVRC